MTAQYIQSKKHGKAAEKGGLHTASNLLHTAVSALSGSSVTAGDAAMQVDSHGSCMSLDCNHAHGNHAIIGNASVEMLPPDVTQVKTLDGRMETVPTCSLDPSYHVGPTWCNDSVSKHSPSRINIERFSDARTTSVELSTRPRAVASGTFVVSVTTKRTRTTSTGKNPICVPGSYTSS